MVTFGSTTTATMRINGDAIIGESQSEPEEEESEEDDSASTIARRCPMINFGAF